MDVSKTRSEFVTILHRPTATSDEGQWAFVVLPAEVSARLPRRGRTTIEGTLDGYAFEALLEPDGQKSHWLKLDEELLRAANVQVGEDVSFAIQSVEREPEPELPDDLVRALEASPDARATWEQTTTLARVDWVHWLTSAKQAKTRESRLSTMCDMLARGKKKVCCFDPSGFYSKAFSAPTPQQ